MTHRERLQKMIRALDEVYEEIGYLRDHSTPDMAKKYNEARGNLPKVSGILQQVDNQLMPDSIAQKEL